MNSAAYLEDIQLRLQKGIRLIRESAFCPDAIRANYFLQSGLPSVSTPAHVVMQPFTPAFIERSQPVTPTMAAPVRSFEPAHGVSTVRALDVDDEVKTEGSWSVMPPGKIAEVIKVSSDSDDDSSESASVHSSTHDDGIDLDPDDGGCVPAVQDGGQRSDTVVARSDKTKIVHECRDRVPVRLPTQDDFLEFLEGS